MTQIALGKDGFERHGPILAPAETSAADDSPDGTGGSFTPPITPPGGNCTGAGGSYDPSAPVHKACCSGLQSYCNSFGQRFKCICR